MPPRLTLQRNTDPGTRPRLDAARRVMEVFLSRFDPRDLPTNYPPDPASRDRIYGELQRCVDEASGQLPPGVDRNAVLDHVANEAVALGALEYFLDDNEVTAVHINGPERVLVERRGVLTEANHLYTGPDFLYLTAQRLLSMQGHSSGSAPAHSEVRFNDGTLVQVVLPPVAVGAPAISVRKPRRWLPSLAELVDKGTLSAGMSEFLQQSVAARRTLLVAGPAGGGRTALVNALLGLVPDGARIVAVESTSMLQLSQRSSVTLETQPESSYAPAVSASQLVDYALRLRPDCLVVDDIAGAEAQGLLRATAAGAAGSMGVVSAFSAGDAVQRLHQMALLEGRGLTAAAVAAQIERGIDVVVVLHRFADGTRRVVEVAEVAGSDEAQVHVESIFVFEQTGMGTAGGGAGNFVATGYVPRFYRELGAGGVSLDTGIFRD